jgi:hypothetical protein
MTADSPRVRSIKQKGYIARLYLQEDLSEAQRWHDKCGHMGLRKLRRVVPALVKRKLPEKLRCKSCIQGKIHRFPHKFLHNHEKPTYEPGECIVTDLMGPYTRSIRGYRYAQVFKD